MTSKALAKTLDTLKRDLELGNTASLATALESAASADLLRGLREQKALFRAPSAAVKQEVATLLRAAAQRVLEERANALYNNYIDFSLLAMELGERLTASVKQILQGFPAISCSMLLFIAEQFHLELLTHVTADPPSHPDTRPLRETVAADELYVHLQNAKSNDFFWALARAFNQALRQIESSGQAVSSNPAHLAAAGKPFGQLLHLASDWNALEFLIDSVSFGDFAVRELTERLAQKSVTLEFVDPKLNLHRRLSIRRRLAHSRLSIQPLRNVKDYLTSAILELVPTAIAYYQTLWDHLPDLTADDLKSCQTKALQLLTPLDLEDDLLLATSEGPPAIAAHYIAAVGLNVCAEVARLVRSRLPERVSDSLIIIKIPFDLVAGIASKHSDQLAIKQALHSICPVAPVARHFDLVKMPFIRIDDECAQPLGASWFSNWSTSVREALIDGGTLGRNLGAVWETYLAGKLERGGWKVVGRNIRLKVAGCVLTDIDIVLLRGDLLLLAQVKAVTGSGGHTYDHWKNRNIIENGCRQARLAADLLRNEPQRLVSMTSRKVSDLIKHIEPVVFTNCHELDRWECECVAVLGPAGTLHLTEGASMTYVNSATGAVVEKARFTPSDPLSTADILWILKNSLEPLVCSEDGRVEQITEEFQGVRWQIPTFVVKSPTDAPIPPPPDISPRGHD